VLNTQRSHGYRTPMWIEFLWWVSLSILMAEKLQRSHVNLIPSWITILWVDNLSFRGDEKSHWSQLCLKLFKINLYSKGTFARTETGWKMNKNWIKPQLVHFHFLTQFQSVLLWACIEMKGKWYDWFIDSF